MALAAKGVAASAVWRERGGNDQDIAIDVRKAFKRFTGVPGWSPLAGNERS